MGATPNGRDSFVKQNNGDRKLGLQATVPETIWKQGNTHFDDW